MEGVSVSSTVRQGDYVTITNVVTSPYKRGNIPLYTEGNIDWKQDWENCCQRQIKDCRKCSFHAKRRQETPNHNCTNN